MFTEIELNQDYKAIVNDGDKEMLSNYVWFTSYDESRIYAVAKIDGYTVRMHRLIMNAREDQIVDHINGNTLDNRRENLRFVTSSQNAMNRRRRSDNKSGVVGVHWSKAHNRWLATISINKKKTTIGLFKTKEEAVEARKKKEQEVYGEYVRSDEFKEMKFNTENIVKTPAILNRVSKRNKTGKKGVRYHPQRNKLNPYSARIKHNEKDIHIGYFPTFEEAAAARDKAEREYYPQYFNTDEKGLQFRE